jgi:starvation-inducible DNA-binding protein
MFTGDYLYIENKNMERKFKRKVEQDQPLGNLAEMPKPNDFELNTTLSKTEQQTKSKTNPKKQSKMSYLNFDLDKAKNTSKELNVLLADYHMYYQKLRNYHWNIVGRSFFDLHEKFEEMYDDAVLKIDEIAERILTLRYQPTSNYSEYIKMSNLKETKSELSDLEMVHNLLEDHGHILKQMSKVVEVAGESNDEGTIDLIGAYIRELETTSWMLDAWRMNTEDTRKAV